MLKMMVGFDEQKIVQSGQSADSVRRELDDTMRRMNLVKEADGVFVGTGSQHDFARFGNAIYELKDAGWFRPYVERWLWYTGNDCDDLIIHYGI